jgi:hypothetical protein
MWYDVSTIVTLAIFIENHINVLATVRVQILMYDSVVVCWSENFQFVAYLTSTYATVFNFETRFVERTCVSHQRHDVLSLS